MIINLKNARVLIVAILYLISNSLHCQDSLYNIYKNKRFHDTIRLDALHQFINSFRKNNPDSALKLAYKEYQEAKYKNYSKIEGKALNLLGLIHLERGKIDTALQCQIEALKIMKDINNEKGVANCYHNIAMVYSYGSHLSKALQYSVEAIKIRMKINDSIGLSKSYVIVGNIYSNLKQYNLGNSFYQKAALYTPKHEKGQFASIFTNMGINFAELKKYYLAIKYKKLAMEISKSLKNQYNLSKIYANLALVYDDLKLTDSVIVYNEKSIEIKKLINDEVGLAYSYSNMCGFYSNIRENEKAIRYGKEGLILAKKINAPDLVEKTFQNLASAYANLKKYDTALFYFQKHSLLKDSLFNIENTKQLSDIRINYEIEKKEYELTERNKKQRYNAILISAFLILIVILLVLFLIIKNKHQKIELTKQQLQLEQKLLRLQMNPHFIFNCLGTIQSYVATSKPLEANRYLANLAIVMRRVLEDSKYEYISLQKEMDFLDNYLNLQALVLDNELNYEIQAENIDNIESISIPTMLVQPFIENAIVHGISKNKNKVGFISINFKLIGNSILCIIEDNGIGFSKSKEQNSKEHNSMAIQIVKERLAFLEKKSINDISISINNLYDEQKNSIGTKVELYLPILIS